MLLLTAAATPAAELNLWVLGGKDYHGVISGLDASGKTTLLYQLRLGETVTTIPTIGFNVETITYNGSNFALWDVGGCDRLRVNLRHYLAKDWFVVFVHDCAQADRLDESLGEFHSNLDAMAAVGARHMWILFNKQDLLLPAERERIVKEHRLAFETRASQASHSCVIAFLDLPGFSAAIGDQIDAVLSAVCRTIQDVEKAVAKPNAKDKNKTVAKAEPPPGKDELVSRVKNGIQEALGTGDFRRAFESGDVLAWDHFSHLRAGYFVMLDCSALEQPSIIACSDAFIDHLERLRALDPTRFRNTTHRTMTVFWLAQLQVAALQYQHRKGLDSLPSYDDFGRVLLCKPELMHSGLWKEHYSKDTLFSVDARENWVPPDLKALPSLITPAQRTSLVRTEEGLNTFLSCALVAIQESLASGARRGGIVKSALQTLQTTIIRLRATDNAVPPYSETKAYFWIQFTHAALTSLASPAAATTAAAREHSGAITALTLAVFRAVFKVTGQEWRTHYTPALWESVGARMEFKNPDLKPLPAFIAMAPGLGKHA